MKLVKMSLAAAMLMGASAYAEIKNVKFDGAAKLIYQTADWELTPAESAAGLDTGLFTQGDLLGGGASYGGSAGGAAIQLGMTGDVADAVSFGLELQAVGTLGLENNLVNNDMYGGTTAATQWGASQMYLAKTIGKTTVKVGRQELNTPMAFTEKWNLAKNTFDAGVLVNSDIPKTTLVAAWVGKHNGAPSGTTATVEGDAYVSLAEGVYAFGAVNTSVPNTTLQGWYYDFQGAETTAYWLQGDTKVALDNDMALSFGAQYANVDVDTATDASTIWALKAAFDVAGVNFFAAYSDADEDGTSGNFANVSTGDKTKIYTGTGSIYMDGIVTNAGASTYKLGVSTKAGPVKLGASYADASDVGADGSDISAWDVKASGNVAGVGLTAIYTSVSNDTAAAGSGGMYNGRDTDTLRIIASLKF